MSEDTEQLTCISNMCNLTGVPTKLSSSVNSMWEAPVGKDFLIFRFYSERFKQKLQHELAILEFCRNKELKTPRLVEVNITRYKTPILVYKKIPGQPLRQDISKLSSNELTAVLREVNTLLDVVQDFNINGHVGYLHEESRFSSVPKYLCFSLENYLNTAEEFGLLSRVQIKSIEESVHSEMGSVNPIPRLTYIDLSSRNILIENRKFAGLIDWEFLLGAHPLMGFGNLLLKEGPKRKHLTRALRNSLSDSDFKSAQTFSLYRGAELLSYMPTTELYSTTERSKRICEVQRGIDFVLRGEKTHE